MVHIAKFLIVALALQALPTCDAVTVKGGDVSRKFQVAERIAGWVLLLPALLLQPSSIYATRGSDDVEENQLSVVTEHGANFVKFKNKTRGDGVCCCPQSCLKSGSIGKARVDGTGQDMLNYKQKGCFFDTTWLGCVRPSTYDCTEQTSSSRSKTGSKEACCGTGEDFGTEYRGFDQWGYLTVDLDKIVKTLEQINGGGKETFVDYVSTISNKKTDSNDRYRKEVLIGWQPKIDRGLNHADDGVWECVHKD